MTEAFICKKCKMNVHVGINGQYMDLALHMEQNHKTKYTSLLGDKKFRYFDRIEKECEHKEWELISSDMATDYTTIVDVYRCVDCGKEVTKEGRLE